MHQIVYFKLILCFSEQRVSSIQILNVDQRSLAASLSWVAAFVNSEKILQFVHIVMFL